MHPRLRAQLFTAFLLSACASRERVLTVHLADYTENRPQSRFRVEMPGGEASLYAEATPVLDDRDFRSASFSQDGSGLPILRLCFSPTGREKFAQVAEKNVQRRLVFLIQGKLLFAPVIDSGTVPECAEIRGSVSAEQAAALRHALR
jgi:preprotein translocase subunit SecD